MTNPLSRRRFLTISAAAAGIAATPLRAAQTARWRGQALGAPASMVLAGLDNEAARPVIRAVELELERLERIFSLYRTESEISRLNRDGRLEAPSPDFLDVLSLSGALHGATGGAFDPTVQPLWLAIARGGDEAGARAAVGWDGLRYDAGAVRFERAGMGLTLNGIAQGHVTDRIAALLRARGLENVLIDMGEIAAIGTRPDGRGWQAGVARPDGTVVRRVALGDRALATSAPAGTPLGEGGRSGHIIAPDGATMSVRQSLVSVSAPRAALADGLSTACCLLDEARARAAVAGFAGARIEYLG